MLVAQLLHSADVSSLALTQTTDLAAAPGDACSAAYSSSTRSAGTLLLVTLAVCSMVLNCCKPMRVVVSIGLAVSEAHSRNSICRAPASMRTLGRRLVRNTTTKYSTTHIQHNGRHIATATECSQPGNCQAGCWCCLGPTRMLQHDTTQPL